MIVITGRTTTGTITTIVGASLLTMVWAAPALPQSEPLLPSEPAAAQSKPLLPWLNKLIQQPQPAAAQSKPLTPPIARPREHPIQQPEPAAAQSKPLTPPMVRPHEQSFQQPPRIATRSAIANGDFLTDARYLPRQRIQFVDPPYVHAHE